MGVAAGKTFSWANFLVRFVPRREVRALWLLRFGLLERSHKLINLGTSIPFRSGRTLALVGRLGKQDVTVVIRFVRISILVIRLAPAIVLSICIRRTSRGSGNVLAIVFL